jgi:hypothetical protein
VWVVIKSLKNSPYFQKGYKLKEKDLLKLGRVRFRVKEICTDSKKKPTANIHDDFRKGPVFVADKPSLMKLNESSKTLPVCRICLCENVEPDNPLVNPCRCAGTMKYVHIKCLQQWLKSRLHTRDTTIAFTIAWKNLDCELCKKAFPSIVEYEGSRYYTLELPRTEAEAYIIFEVLSKDSTQVRGLHFINLSMKPSIKLGRGHESDVRIADISVSRCHANLTLEKGAVYISDNDSKFGTLVQLKRKFPLSGDLNGVMVQVGRTAMVFQITSGTTRTPKMTGAGEVDFDLNEGDDKVDEDEESPEEEGIHKEIGQSPPNLQQRLQAIQAGQNDPNGNPVPPPNIEDLLYDDMNNPNQGGSPRPRNDLDG